MSEGPRISRTVLIAEVVVGLTFAGFMALRASGFPPSVRAANPPVTYALVGLLYFTLTVGLFNLSHIASAKGYRVVGLVLLVFAVLNVGRLLMISLAQY